MTLSKKNILVVLADDDMDDRLFFKEAFEGLKLKTDLLLFKNGQQLLDHLADPENVLPDIVFLDLNMPVMGGIEALRKIRSYRALAEVFIAIYSTSSYDVDIENTFVLGANIYVTKPNSLIDLKSVLQKVLMSSRQYSTYSMNRQNFLMKI